MWIKNGIREILRGKYCNWNGFHFLADIMPIEAGLIVFKIFTICGIEEMWVFGMVIVSQMTREFLRCEIMNKVD